MQPRPLEESECERAFVHTGRRLWPGCMIYSSRLLRQLDADVVYHKAAEELMMQ